MIIKNIYKFISINKLTYLFIIISILTASFHTLIFISLLLIIHEMGHFFTAKIFGIEVDKIYIYPFGGISKFYLPLNYSIIKEFIILINGPLFQIITYYILISMFPSYKSLISTYHYGILIFNLLPIYPLDGGKLLNLIISLFHPYKRSLNISIIISYLCIIVLLLININNIKINLIIMISFLLYKVSKEEKVIDFKYENFLLERYLKKYRFNNSSIIYKEKDFYRSRRHLLKLNNNYIIEKDYLNNKYKP